MRFSLIHRIPGRVRLRAAKPFNVQTAVMLADGLELLDGVEGVRVNPRTGSVLLLYTDEEALPRAYAFLSGAAPLPGSALSVCPPKKDERPSLLPLLRYLFLRPLLPLPLSVCSALAGAAPFLKRCFHSLRHGRLDVEALDGTAIAISLLRGDFRTASLLTLLLGFGDALERYTQKKSLENLASHLALQADRLWVRRGGKECFIPAQDLKENDLVIVRSGTAIPVDGVVAAGTASVNEASMTGEPLGVMRTEGASVYAGTVVESGEIFIRPTSIGKDTRMQQIVRFIEHTEQKKAGIQGRFERLADRAVPFTFALAALVFVFTRSLTRAASVLLVDYSCALRLATPLAILAAMNEGVRRKVMVKGGRFLESLSAVDTVIFDKTGTLTQSHPHVARIVPAEGYHADEVLRLSACLEEHFPHPVARAVVHCAEARRLHHAEEHTEVEYVVAHGIASHWQGRRVLLGSRHYVSQDEGVDLSAMRGAVTELSRQGYSLLYLAIDGRPAGIIAMEDPLRPESAALIRQLQAMGIPHVLMLTGDDLRTASAVASRLGIREYHAQVLPEDKARIVQELKAQGRTVLMLGDGINDSPALSAADVGVTLRDGADLAREVADVLLMGGSPGGLITALELGRRTMRRIHTDFLAIMALNSAFLLGSLLGILQPGLSAVLHNLTTLGVSLNAMRPKLPQGE
ncbi:heavy metal translocating P-type ATPase [uncultured Mailhella sp.]|uniref:heavy metal translocating P-type ATPase n=1 Tax=uncultured Mailhella sp. TaxID=1981031 RepID=UPI00262232C2|nr:heavy metal translocating P-type ATPase [uncultured Mailhella sp.]